MKPYSINTLAVLACLALWMTAVQLDAAPLTNTQNPHNLSSAATHGGPHAADEDQICIFCHTPHSAAPDTALSTRPEPSTASFPLYAQPPAIKGDVPGFEDPTAPNRSQYKNDGSVVYPNGASRLCLSCHDGVTAIGILRDGTNIAMTGGDFVSGTAIIDLSMSHPISFVYDNTVLTSDILPVRGAGTYQLPPRYQAVPFDNGVDVPLDSAMRMQCTTCHDPHDDTSLDDPSLPPFWRHETLIDNLTYADSYEEVCGQCHLGIGLTPGALDPDPAGDHNPGPVFGVRP